MKKLLSNKLFILCVLLTLISACSDSEKKDPKENPAEVQMAEHNKKIEQQKKEEIETKSHNKTPDVAPNNSANPSTNNQEDNPKDKVEGSSESTNSNDQTDNKSGSEINTNSDGLTENQKINFVKSSPNKNSLNTDFAVKDTDMVFGDPNSKVVVVEYFSFTCPHCSIFLEKSFPKLKEKYIDTNKVAYVFREFVGNKQDLHASTLARCKKDPQIYKNFMSVLLSRQESWAFNKNFEEILTNIALVGGVSAEEYSTCMADKNLQELLMENTKIPTKVPGFIGTPAFFINGKYFNPNQGLDELLNYIDAEIIKSAHENVEQI